MLISPFPYPLPCPESTLVLWILTRSIADLGEMGECLTTAPKGKKKKVKNQTHLLHPPRSLFHFHLHPPIIEDPYNNRSV